MLDRYAQTQRLPTRAKGTDMMLRMLFSTSSIFLSLVLGALALALVGINYPEVLSMMIGWARQLKGGLTSTGLAAKYNIWIELLLEERQLLFMFFTIGARIVLGIVGSLFSTLLGSGRRAAA